MLADNELIYILNHNKGWVDFDGIEYDQYGNPV